MNEKGQINTILNVLSKIDRDQFPKLAQIIEHTSNVPPYPTNLVDLCSKLIRECREQETLLYYAVERGDAELVDKLLDAGFDSSTHKKSRNAAFKSAIEKFFETLSNDSPPALIQSRRKIAVTLFNKVDPADVGVTKLITDAADEDCVDLLKIYNIKRDKHDSPRVTSVLKNHYTFFEKTLKSRSIRVIKYLIDLRRPSEFEKSVSLEEKSIVQDRFNSSDTTENQLILNYIKTKMTLDQNVEDYQNELFQLDAKIVRKIYGTLKTLTSSYEDTGGHEHGFESDKLITAQEFRLDQYPDDLLPLSSHLRQESSPVRENIVIFHLRRVAKYIEILGEHDRSIKNTFDPIVPWVTIKTLPDALENHEGWGNYGRLILESISTDMYKLRDFFRDVLIPSYTDSDNNKPSFQKFQPYAKNVKRANVDTPPPLDLPSVHRFVDKGNDLKIIESLLFHIRTVAALVPNKKYYRPAFLQCLQNIGETTKHLSQNTIKMLEDRCQNFELLKKFRNDLGHAWESPSDTRKLLEILEHNGGSNTNMTYFFDSWRDFLIYDFKALLISIRDETYVLTSIRPYDRLLTKLPDLLKDYKCTAQSNPSSYFVNVCVTTFFLCNSIFELFFSIIIPEDFGIFPSLLLIMVNFAFVCIMFYLCPASAFKFKILYDPSQTRVSRQLALVYTAMAKIQSIVSEISDTCNHDYLSIREKLRTPHIHYTCVLMLTIIGEAVRDIRVLHDFLSVAKVELFQELDFLRWVRNALMHSDKVKETGTLVQYLSNDLLTDFSIATHGQKVIEFSKYFDYVLDLVNKCYDEVRRIGDSNYFQHYSGDDKKYFKSDIQRRQRCKSQLSPNFCVDRIFKHKAEIEAKCVELNIRIVGLIGRLAKFGTAKAGDSSGFLVEVVQGDMLSTTADFKKYLMEMFNYRLYVVDEIQLKEYFRMNDCSDEYVSEFVHKTSAFSIEHLEWNIELLNAVGDPEFYIQHNTKDVDMRISGEYIQVSVGHVCFCADYYNIQKIHDHIFDSTNTFFELLYDPHNNSAEFEPFLHQMCEIYRQQSEKDSIILDIIRLSLDRGADINVQDVRGNTMLHKLSLWDNDQLCNLLCDYKDRIDANTLNTSYECALDLALPYGSPDLVRFLKDRTDMGRLQKRLLISAPRSLNEFIQRLVNEDPDEVSVDYEGLRSTFKIPLEYGAGVSCFQSSNLSPIQRPLLWSLRNDRHLDLSLMLAKRASHTNFNYNGVVYPIHLAIDLNITVGSEKRLQYLELIKEIAQKSQGKLDVGYQLRIDSSTPLALAAKQKDLDVLRILVQNGADINRMNFSVSKIFDTNDPHVIKFFLDNGLIEPPGYQSFRLVYPDLMSQVYSINRSYCVVSQGQRITQTDFGPCDSYSRALKRCLEKKHHPETEIIEALRTCGRSRGQWVNEETIQLWKSDVLTSEIKYELGKGDFYGAKLLIEHGATPYDHLTILLIDALSRKDEKYVKLLLSKSVIVMAQETSRDFERRFDFGVCISHLPLSKLRKAFQFLVRTKLWIPEHVCSHVLDILVNYAKVEIDLWKRDGSGRSLAFRGTLEIKKVFAEKGVIIFDPDKKGRTIVHRACETKDLSLKWLVLKNQKDIYVKGKKGKTAWYMAVWNGHWEIIDWLLHEKYLQLDRITPIEKKDLLNRPRVKQVLELLEIPCILQHWVQK